MKQTNFTNLEVRDKFIFKWLTVFAIAYIFPIILADRYYMDDLGRSIDGYTNWESNGRYLTEKLMMLINDGAYLTDLSPLLQILAVILLSYSLTIFSKRYFSSFSEKLVIGGLFFAFLNPFMLENLSYKFDSLSMVIGLCAALVFFSVERSNFRINFFGAFFSVFVALSTYQATLGFFFILLLFDLLYELRLNTGVKKYVKKTCVTIFGMGIACLLYKLSSVYWINDGYSLRLSQTIPFNSEWFLAVLNHLTMYIEFYGKMLRSESPFIIGLIIISVLFAAIFIYFENNSKNLKNLIVFVIGFILIAAFFLIAPVLPLIVLKEIHILPRVFISFSGVTLMSGIALMYLSKRYKIASIIMCLCIFYGFVFAYSYGNSLKSQKMYDVYVAQNLARDIEELSIDIEFDKITFASRLPVSRELRHTIGKYPLMEDLVPVNIAHWATQMVKHYLVTKDIQNIDPTMKDFDFVKNSNPIRKNILYSIYKDENRLLISFKDFQFKFNEE